MEAHAATLQTRRLSVGSRAWKWLREHAIVIYGALAIAYMLIPIALIIVFSFNDPAGKFNFTWQGFTLVPLGPSLRDRGADQRAPAQPAAGRPGDR